MSYKRASVQFKVYLYTRSYNVTLVSIKLFYWDKGNIVRMSVQVNIKKGSVKSYEGNWSNKLLGTSSITEVVHDLEKMYS